MSRLYVILADQLHPAPHPLLKNFDRENDTLLMVETEEEAGSKKIQKAKLVLLFSALRHRAEELRKNGYPVTYLRIGEHTHTFIADAIQAEFHAREYRCVMMLEPGDLKLENTLKERLKNQICFLPDPFFICSEDDFRKWAGSVKSLKPDQFYSWQRKQLQILPTDDPARLEILPIDSKNHPVDTGVQDHLPGIMKFKPDPITLDVIKEIEQRFPSNPGKLEHFYWPVTHMEAMAAAADFIENRLPEYAAWQNVMRDDEPNLWHSRLSAALNLKLIDPAILVEQASLAFHEGKATLASVESFIRPIIGLREFARGAYRLHAAQMPKSNQHFAGLPLPDWFWTGKTKANCLAKAIRQSIDYGYAHPAQRQLILGNFALIVGISPRQTCNWFSTVFVDSAPWITEPSVFGLALDSFPAISSRPACASGASITKVSNYCENCHYRPGIRTGDYACPFTNLYWDFLMRNAHRLAANPIMAVAVRTSKNIDDIERADISSRASQFRRYIDDM